MKNLTVLENLTTHGRHVRVNGGQQNGKHVDFLGLDFNQELQNKWNTKFFDQLKQFQNSIESHVRKVTSVKPDEIPADLIAIDYKYFAEIGQAAGKTPTYIKSQIDLYLINNYSSTFLNNHLIKLNY